MWSACCRPYLEAVVEERLRMDSDSDSGSESELLLLLISNNLNYVTTANLNAERPFCSSKGAVDIFNKVSSSMDP